MKKSTMMLLTLMSVMMFSCKDKDLYDPNAVKPGEEQKVANTFDFSTVQDVMLTVDYSAFNTHGPVFFSIYHENPFVGEGEDEHLNENIKPIYEDYTDKSGRFNQTVELPAYAKHLYVVTGNFFVTERLMETDVQNGGAKATAKSAGTRAASRAVTRRGAQTNDVSKMPQLSFNVDDNGNKIGERVYQDWQTPLGTWDDRSGAPSYLIDKSKVDKKLIFSDEDMEGLYATVSQVLNANKACRKTYRDHEDLVLDKASEVTITMLGGSTCWNSSLGYYYYEVGKEPTDTKDLNIIMLFPNTQDGNWARFDSRKNDYNGNIGVNRGDAIQLMYYPNIADGDLSVVSNVFPANTKIGFILKSTDGVCRVRTTSSRDSRKTTESITCGAHQHQDCHIARYPQDLRTRSRLTSIPIPMATAVRRSLPTRPLMAASMPSSPSRMPATTRTTTTSSSHLSPSMLSNRCPRLNPTASSPRASMPSRTCGLPRATTI